MDIKGENMCIDEDHKYILVRQVLIYTYKLAGVWYVEPAHLVDSIEFGISPGKVPHSVRILR